MVLQRNESSCKPGPFYINIIRSITTKKSRLNAFPFTLSSRAFRFVKICQNKIKYNKKKISEEQ